MRRTNVVTIESEGRDKGKTFLLTEMSASQAEKWAARALLALLKSGVHVPDEVASTGIAGLATIAIQAFGGISWELAEPLLDEMMNCVQIKPDPRNPNVIRALIEDDVEEVTTRLLLRKELLELHLGFSLAAKLSTLKASAAAMISKDTEMSPQVSE